MPNPRAQKQLALNSAVQELKTLGQPLQALGDMLASTLRGSTAATLGVGGDIRELIDLLGPEKVEAMLGKRVMPTTEEMKAKLPKATSYDHPYESIGEFLPLPGTGTAIKAAGYGAGRGAGALTRAGLEAVNNAHVYGQGPLAAITPQPMRMFIGPQAKTYDIGRAMKAEEMLKAGKSRDEVWKATGTMIGKDGIPRQNISDASSIFRTANDLKQLKEDYKAMIEEGKEKLRPDRTGQKDLFPKQLTEAKKPFREQLAGLKEDLREIDKNPRTQGVAARWTLEHPELYRAYPQLADINVTQRPTIGAEKGSLTSLGGIIKNLDVKDINDPRSVALHEMQHAIQNIEGMSRGASPEDAFKAPEYKEIYNEIKGKMPDDMSSVMKRKFERDAAMEWYMRQHGEAEARATAQRQYRTPQELLEKHPYEDYDRPESQLLLREGVPYLGVSKDSSVMPEETKRAYEAMRAKAAQDAAEQVAYDKATREMPLNQRPSMEEFRALNAQPSQADLDQMRLDLDDQKFAGGGLTKLAKLARAPAKTKAEIEAIAERMAPQVLGEYVRASEKSAKTVAGKTKKQFEREKELQHDIRPTSAERPLPKEVNIEDLKNQVMMGISGDPTVTGQTLYSVAGRELRSPSPQHGGPLYGLGHDKEHFWASNLGAAQGVQNRAREIGQQYDAPVIGNYVMMGPDSYSYAQHFADANLQNIRPEEMTKAQIEGFNKLVRQGSLKSGPRPTWPGIENPEEAYLHMAVDPELRKHFGNLMQMPTVTQQFGLPSGLDVAHAVTEPSLRDLEIGVTGKSMGRMRPDVKNLKLSEHPTYSHDIPGEFMGGLRFPVPYELSFPDSLKAVRENPAQAPQEFGSFKMVGPRQIIDQQLIDEIRAYEERMRQLTGKADGGAVKQLSQTAQEHLAKLKAIRDQLAPVADAWTAKQAEDANKYTPDIQQFKLPIGKAAGGEISADDIILEERPL